MRRGHAGGEASSAAILKPMVKMTCKKKKSWLSGLFRLLAAVLCGFLWRFQQTADDVISLLWGLLLDSRLFQHESFEVCACGKKKTSSCVRVPDSIVYVRQRGIYMCAACLDPPVQKSAWSL